jgi:hypothetical protein
MFVIGCLGDALSRVDKALPTALGSFISSIDCSTFFTSKNVAGHDGITGTALVTRTCEDTLAIGHICLQSCKGYHYVLDYTSPIYLLDTA